MAKEDMEMLAVTEVAASQEVVVRAGVAEMATALAEVQRGAEWMEAVRAVVVRMEVVSEVGAVQRVMAAVGLMVADCTEVEKTEEALEVAACQEGVSMAGVS